MLSVSGLPTGATGTFNPATVTPGSAGASSTLTVTIPAIGEPRPAQSLARGHTGSGPALYDAFPPLAQGVEGQTPAAGRGPGFACLRSLPHGLRWRLRIHSIPDLLAHHHWNQRHRHTFNHRAAHSAVEETPCEKFKTMIAMFLLLPIAAVSARSALAQGSVQPAAPAEKPLRSELALDYSYLHSNAPPGGCGCFNLNGGSATFAWAIKPGSWDLVGDVVSTHAGSVSSAGYSLTLTAFTAGVRYIPPFHTSSLRPFGQVLLGLAHSSGTLVQSPNAEATNAGAAFASNIGGGLDMHASRRFSIRLFEADYLLTTFDNGSNNRQNNLRISAGVVMHFGQK